MFFNAFILALREIRRNITRAFLTVIGVVIGVAAVVTMVTLGRGATEMVKSQISNLGSNLMILRPGQGWGQWGAPLFSLTDVQAVREQVASAQAASAWQAWVLYMLEAVEQTSTQTLQTVRDINHALADYRQRIRAQHKFYSQDLINNLFRHPYTKIEFVMDELHVTRQTAAKYLDEVTRIGLLSKHRLGKENYYLNHALFELLLNVGQAKREAVQ